MPGRKAQQQLRGRASASSRDPPAQPQPLPVSVGRAEHAGGGGEEVCPPFLSPSSSPGCENKARTGGWGGPGAGVQDLEDPPPPGFPRAQVSPTPRRRLSPRQSPVRTPQQCVQTSHEGYSPPQCLRTQAHCCHPPGQVQHRTQGLSLPPPGDLPNTCPLCLSVCLSGAWSQGISLASPRGPRRSVVSDLLTLSPSRVAGPGPALLQALQGWQVHCCLRPCPTPVSQLVTPKLVGQTQVGVQAPRDHQLIGAASVPSKPREAPGVSGVEGILWPGRACTQARHAGTGCGLRAPARSP